MSQDDVQPYTLPLSQEVTFECGLQYVPAYNTRVTLCSVYIFGALYLHLP
jgi:hypothetical protein